MVNKNEIDCKHKNKCTSYGTWKCLHCKYNRNLKRDYYEPIYQSNEYPYPYIYYPYYPNNYTKDPVSDEYSGNERENES